MEKVMSVITKAPGYEFELLPDGYRQVVNGTERTARALPPKHQGKPLRTKRSAFGRISLHSERFLIKPLRRREERLERWTV